jgi:hypothetical protein
LVADDESVETPVLAPIVEAEPGGDTLPRRAPAPLLIVALAVALAAAGALVARPLWRASRGAVHPQARYLPHRCDLFQSIRWPELVESGVLEKQTELPGLAMAGRCATFVENAGLEPRDVERINVGRAADGSGLLLVYRLTRPVGIDEIMEQPPFRAAEYQEEAIGGVLMYSHSAGGTAIAAPEEQVIINGDTELVRSALRRRGGFRGPSSALVETLDFSATCVAVTNGPPQPLVEGYLQESAPLAVSVLGTTDSFHYGSKMRLLRILHVGDNRAALGLWQSLRRSLGQTINNPETPDAVRQLLDEVQSTAVVAEVRIQVALEADSLSQECLDALSRLFQ